MHDETTRLENAIRAMMAQTVEGCPDVTAEDRFKAIWRIGLKALRGEDA